MHHILKRRAVLLVFFIFLAMPTGIMFAQEAVPVASYIYYGKRIDSDTMRDISAKRYYELGEMTTCVYVPSEDYSPVKVEPVQTFHCFDTEEEAGEFTLWALETYRPFIEAKYKEAFGDTMPERPKEGFREAASSDSNTESAKSSCVYWSVYAHTFMNTWLDDVCYGAISWASSGIWSVWGGSIKPLQLSDNASYPGQSWLIYSTVYILNAGAGGSRQASHCHNPYPGC